MASRSRDLKALSAMLGFFAALGGNWLITPANHPDAGLMNFIAAWVQLIGCGAMAVWLWRRARTTAATLPPDGDT